SARRYWMLDWSTMVQHPRVPTPTTVYQKAHVLSRPTKSTYYPSQVLRGHSFLASPTGGTGKAKEREAARGLLTTVDPSGRVLPAPVTAPHRSAVNPSHDAAHNPHT